MAGTRKIRLLITAGPTHEPIDSVRYLANRSSGRLGIAIAEAGARRGWEVTLLLGPTPRAPEDTRIRLLRFRTTADLQTLLRQEAPNCDILIMAAAVADYRPIPPSPPEGEGRGEGSPSVLKGSAISNLKSQISNPPPPSLQASKPSSSPSGSTPASTASTPNLPHKLPRTSSNLTLTLEPTPDLLAEAAANRRPGQTIVGFALEPRERMLDSARAKLQRKNIDFIVANPLETMDAETIEATLIGRDGSANATPGAMGKEGFGEWVLDRVRASNG